ncbi:MAG: flagellar basal body protein [Rhodospirillaceae bacterium]
MDLTNLKLFQMAAKRMDWLSKRQQVLSQNIANADTPAYGAQDLKELSFRDLMRRRRALPTLEKTSPMHIAATRVQPRFRPDEEKSPYEVSPGGNAVVIEEQLTKVSETQSNHRLASNIYSKHVALLKMAIGNPNR